MSCKLSCAGVWSLLVGRCCQLHLHILALHCARTSVTAEADNVTANPAGRTFKAICVTRMCLLWSRIQKSCTTNLSRQLLSHTTKQQHPIYRPELLPHTRYYTTTTIKDFQPLNNNNSKPSITSQKLKVSPFPQHVVFSNIY